MTTLTNSAAAPTVINIMVRPEQINVLDIIIQSLSDSFEGQINYIKKEECNVPIKDNQGNKIGETMAIPVTIEIIHNADYTVIAKIEALETGNLIQSNSVFNTNIDLSKYYKGKINCHKCNTSHYRKYGFIILSNKDNSTFSVGSECVNHYTGKSILDALIKFDLWKILKSFCDGESAYFFNKSTLDSNSNVSTKEVMKRALIASSLFGFHPMANEQATGKLIQKSFMDPNNMQCSIPSDYPDINNIILDFDKFIASLAVNNDYIHNVKTLYANNTIQIKKIPILVGIISTYFKQKESAKIPHNINDTITYNATISLIENSSSNFMVTYSYSVPVYRKSVLLITDTGLHIYYCGTTKTIMEGNFKTGDNVKVTGKIKKIEPNKITVERIKISKLK